MKGGLSIFGSLFLHIPRLVLDIGPSSKMHCISNCGEPVFACRRLTSNRRLHCGCLAAASFCSYRESLTPLLINPWTCCCGSTRRYLDFCNPVSRLQAEGAEPEKGWPEASSSSTNPHGRIMANKNHASSWAQAYVNSHLLTGQQTQLVRLL